jgi:hypothetical protein
MRTALYILNYNTLYPTHTMSYTTTTANYLLSHVFSITAKSEDAGGKNPTPVLELLNLARPFAALRAVDMDVIAGKIVAALASS